MRPEGSWIYQEPRERHAFSLCRVFDPGTPDEWYDQLGVVQVVPDRLNPGRLAERLHDWAVATLRAGGHGFGRYHAALSQLDEDDEPWRPERQEYIDWSGEAVLSPVVRPEIVGGVR
nr:hypothetical protein [Micromonospora sp. DSM 115978]